MGMKILLVEDGKAIAALMSKRLTAMGHEVHHAENGKEGVEVFRSTQPDVVLMDVEMPVMNGIEATNKIRALESTQHCAWTPIIFLTAMDSHENLVTAIEAGGDDYLVKGVPEEVLRSKMKALARIAAMRDQLSLANQKLEMQASLDGLTGLLNRRKMDSQLDKAWANSSKTGQSFGLMMIDIDNFKAYNDHYGHQQGDDCLRRVAQAINQVIERNNQLHITQQAFAARYGGEEFAVVLPNSQESVVQTIADEVVKSVRQLGIAHVKNANWGVATISAGVAWLVVTSGTIGEMFNCADKVLYQAKHAGRNRCILTKPEPQAV